MSRLRRNGFLAKIHISPICKMLSPTKFYPMASSSGSKYKIASFKLGPYMDETSDATSFNLKNF